jgi:hypothetical protein
MYAFCTSRACTIRTCQKEEQLDLQDTMIQCLCSKVVGLHRWSPFARHKAPYNDPMLDEDGFVEVDIVS